MPPLEMWIQGNTDITAWMVQPTAEHVRRFRAGAGARERCAGVRPVQARPGTAATSRGRLQVHEATDGKFSRFTWFLDTGALFPLFGLPPHLDEKP